MADVKEPVSSQPQVCVPQWRYNYTSQRHVMFCVLRRALLRCQWVEIGTQKIAQLIVMGSVIGAFAYGTASTGMTFVRRTKMRLCEPLIPLC